MYKQCRTEQSAQRQREMEQGLLRLMGTRQFEEITVSDLCQEMGIPRKSFYRYFSGKDGVLHALIDHAVMDYDLYTMRGEVEPQLSPLEYMEQILTYWVQHKPLLDALERSGLSGMLVMRAMEYTEKLGSMPNFLKTTDKRLQGYGTMFAVCGLMSMILRWHHDGFPNSVEEMAKLALRLFSEPMFDGTWE